MRLRIVVSSLCKPTSRDANAIQIDRMCQALSGEAHEVTLTAIGHKPDRARDYYLLVLPWRFTRLRIRLMQALTRICLWRLRPDILFTRSPLLALCGLRYGITVVLELHSLPNEDSKTRIALQRCLCHCNLRRVVTISQALANDLVASFGTPHQGCDIVVAHDGAQLVPRPGPATEHDGPLRVGYFGHLYDGKGMEMIATLTPLIPELRFEVYGGTDADILRWRATCAGQKNLTLHGYIPHEQVAARMAECDILIAPYAEKVSHIGRGDIGRWMSPLKLFEYMAAERPIVASDLPVLREVVSDGKTAFLCPPGNSAAFAAALRLLATNQALRSSLSAAGRDLLEAEYTWEKRAQRVLDGIVPALSQ
jgi:glycosyltransferase involved in cell wall biosynthesis